VGFEILTQTEVEGLTISARTRTPTADMQKYVDYIQQTLSADSNDPVGVITPDNAEASKKDQLREANTTVARVKRAANIAGADLIVTKVGPIVYFRAAMEGESPNAGPHAVKRERASRAGPMSVEEFQSLQRESDDPYANEIPDVEDEPSSFNIDEAEAPTGGRRRR